jgi:outer membrane lipoprotein-sorting protein
VKLPRQARWAVPVGAVAAVGLVIAGSVIAGAQTTPRLPARTTAQLLAAVSNPAALPPAMTAVVQETASLGLPDLPGSSDPLSPLSLLSGTHTFKIWYDGPARVRVAVPVSLGETDLRRDGNSAWIWNSRTNQATHYLLPAGTPAGPLGSPSSVPPQSIPTPQQLAKQILAAVGPTTTVGLQQNVTVAGQAAYQLSLAPKDGRSLIGQVRIAIDARDSLPLQVQVFGRGASGPAFSVGYTSLSFAVPAASNFSFSPPPGAKVKTVTVPAGRSGAVSGTVPIPAGPPGTASAVPIPAGPPGTASAVPIPAGSTERIVISSGNGGGSVTLGGGEPAPPAVVKQLEAAFASQLPASLSKAQRAALEKQFASRLTGKSPGAPAGIFVGSPGTSGSSGGVQLPFMSGPLGAGPRVMGQGWLSVAVLPGQFTAQGGFAPQGGANVPDMLGALAGASTPVHGAWGSGRLLRTSLVSVLMTDKGEVLVGAVVPSVLYADAAQLG